MLGLGRPSAPTRRGTELDDDGRKRRLPMGLRDPGHRRDAGRRPTIPGLCRDHDDGHEEHVDNGSVSTATEEVVAAVAPGVLTVFEQHVKPGGPHVQQHTLPIRAGTTVTTEHRVAKTASGALMAATIVKTVTVSISGKVWAYHPEPASTAN
jgi:hypothetical protein